MKSKKMKILLLVNDYYPYKKGEEAKNKIYLASSAPELARHLSSCYKVIVVSRKFKGTKNISHTNKIIVYRLPFLNLPFFRLVTWSFLVFIFITLLKTKYKLIICWDWSTAIPVIFSKIFTHKPFIVSTRGQSQANSHKNSILFPLYWIAEYLTLSLSNMIVHSSRWVKKSFNDIMKLKVKQIVLHHGIDLKKFNPNVNSDLRRKFMINENATILGFFGRLVKGKGLFILLLAFKDLVKKHKNIRLLIVGDGPEKKKIELFLRKNKIENYVFLIGFIKREYIPQYMSICDIIVLPSKSEGFSSVVIESIAMGKVFIGTRVGGAPEVIKNWENGVLINYSVKDLKKAVTILINNKYLMKKIKIRAVETSYEYDWHKIIKKWIKLIENFYKTSKNKN